MTRLPDEEFMDRIADGVELIAPEPAPARLKARILSALLAQQAETGPLLSLTHSHGHGRELCIFGQFVRIVPPGERAKSVNLCRVCHARMLAERSENPPIYWSGCPYVEFKKG